MNSIKSIATLNARELAAGIFSPSASWHADHRASAFISFGGLPLTLSEGDVLAIFSQYGEPVWLRLMRDKETGKSRGFGWLKYEDQRSTDLAVDNLSGAEVSGSGGAGEGRKIRVDHAEYKFTKGKEEEEWEEGRCGWVDMMKRDGGGLDEDEESEEQEEEEQTRRPVLKEEAELRKLIAEHDDEDPMKGFLIEEKKREVEEALVKVGKKKDGDRERERERERERKHRKHRSSDKRNEDDRRKRSRRDDHREDREHRPHGGERTRSPDVHRRHRDRDRDERHYRERDRERRRDGDDEERRHRNRHRKQDG